MKTTFTLKIAIALILVFNQPQCIGQNSTPSEIPYNCNSVFWTINSTGSIQQWDLDGGNVTGGDVVLTSNSGTSIAFAETTDGPVFYVAKSLELHKYQFDSGWSSVSTTLNYNNNGAYQDHHYLLQAGVGITLYYHDGTNFSLVTPVNDYNPQVADLAVDSNGRAFTISKMSNNFYVTIYNQTGLVQAIPINTPPGFTSSCYYGMFMINDALYIAAKSCAPFYPNSLIPVIINGNSAMFGTPIPFNCGDCYDAASCNPVFLSNATFDKLDFVIYPNPAQETITVLLDDHVDEISVYSLDMRLISVVKDSKVIDIRALSSGTYYAQIKVRGKISTERFIKI